MARFTIRVYGLLLHEGAVLVADEIIAQPLFRAGLAELGREIGPDKVTPEKAQEILDEMATGWGRAAVDLVPRLNRHHGLLPAKHLPQGRDPGDQRVLQVPRGRTPGPPGGR